MDPNRHRNPPLLIEEDDSLGPPRAVWLLFLSIVLAKITVISVVFATDFSPMSLLYFFITTWFWVVFAIALFAGPAAVTLRLRKTRRRREALVRSEWEVEG